MNIATGVIGSIISKLAELLKAEYKLQTGVKKQVESLTRELQSAHDFLQEIDTVPPDQLNRQVKSWADEVREASYDMEDILDTFLVSIKGPPETIDKNKLQRLQKKMRGLFVSKTKARHNIGNAIEEVKEKLKEIDERHRRYKLHKFMVSPAAPVSRVDPRIARVHNFNASLLVGIDERKDVVMKMSQDVDMSSAALKTKVVSLVGFGGVGKTTLANAIYDQLIQKFQCGAFVSVGQKPDPVKVLKNILYYLDKNKLDKINSTQVGEDVLIREIIDFLRDKRYLIVIDDVWEIESRRRIIEALTKNNIGSRIIITTRKSEVATGEVYKVQPLSDDYSKKLFYTRIFGGEDKCYDNQQQKVSEAADKILRKCGGVPLAIITMASYLVGKSMEQWLEVCNSIGFCGKDKEQTGDTEWILSLSYYDLPSHLKTCLLYVGIFPEDYMIEKRDLIWMWIGEGFVSGKPGTGLFETGEGYFNDLINRNLIQPVEAEESKTIVGCRVHDMVLDLICSLSCEAKFAIVSNKDQDKIIGSTARRLALQNRVVKDTPLDEARTRSLVATGCNFSSWDLLQSCKLLRVLFLEGCSCVQFDEHVNDLHHLRCLGIHSKYDLEVVPKELGALKFLRVLYLVGGIKGSNLLPSSVGMLTQLVCLCAPSMKLPGGIIKDLTSLQELQIDGPEDDEKSRGQFVKDLGNLLELRVLSTNIGEIHERMQTDLLKSLGNLHMLQCLILDYGELELALLPRGLSNLSIPINSYMLPPFIDPSRLPNLSRLTLYLDSIDDQGLKILGGLPELSYLMLWIRSDHSATLNSTAAQVYFPKLRSCMVHDSMVHFVVNKEGWSVSLYSGPDHPAFGSKKEHDTYRLARAVMPNLQALYFKVELRHLAACNSCSCDNLGLECLPSLQKVTVKWDFTLVDKDVVSKEEDTLRDAIQVHPNRPTVNIKPYIDPTIYLTHIRYRDDDMSRALRALTRREDGS